MPILVSVVLYDAGAGESIITMTCYGFGLSIENEGMYVQQFCTRATYVTRFNFQDASLLNPPTCQRAQVHNMFSRRHGQEMVSKKVSVACDATAPLHVSSAATTNKKN